MLDLPAAVEWVYGWAYSPDDEALQGLDSATLERVARNYRPAEAELLERTAGQAFRFEGPSGPLFLESALWRFSGALGMGESPFQAGQVAWDVSEQAAA